MYAAGGHHIPAISVRNPVFSQLCLQESELLSCNIQRHLRFRRRCFSVFHLFPRHEAFRLQYALFSFFLLLSVFVRCDFLVLFSISLPGWGIINPLVSAQMVFVPEGTPYERYHERHRGGVYININGHNFMAI